METDKEKIDFKRDQEDFVNNIDVVYDEIISVCQCSHSWVAVTERLPKEETLVLVYIEECSIGHNIVIANVRRGTWFESGDWLSFEPTHWVELPKPPSNKIGR